MVQLRRDGCCALAWGISPGAGARGLRGWPVPHPSPHLLQSTSLWCYRLELWGLVAVGLLGLYLFYCNDGLWLSMTPKRSTFPSPQAAPRLPPPTPAPCVANTSMHKIDGFAKLPGHVQDFMRYQHCRFFPELLGIPDKCVGPMGPPTSSSSWPSSHRR